jgi:hypothetical protein
VVGKEVFDKIIVLSLQKISGTKEKYNVANMAHKAKVGF